MKKPFYIPALICFIVMIIITGCHTSKAGKTGQHKGHTWDNFK